MVERLYQLDSYLKEFDATVTKVEEGRVYLDRTAFHPGPSGGLDTDTGWLILPNGERVRVEKAEEVGDDIAHVVGEAWTKFSEGMRVRGAIDWERRYGIMRHHTAAHILIAVLYRKYGALATGGMVMPDMARDDFDLSMVKDWRAALREAVEEANKIISKCIEVKIYWLPREEALKIPGIVKLAERLPPEVEKLRIVEIPGIDIQADGGPHVRNTCEIGKIEIIKLENRGKRKKRIYYRAVATDRTTNTT